MNSEGWALVGVVLGGLIGLGAPVVSYRIERVRRKREIKLRLVQAVYLLFNELKRLTRYQAYHYYYQSRANAENQHLRTLSDSNIIAQVQSNRDNDNSLGKQYEEKSEALSEILTRIESEVHGLVIELNEHYGEVTYGNVKDLIDPEIEKSNNGFYFEQYLIYEKWTMAQFDADKLTLSSELTQRSLVIQENCNVVIKRLLRLLR